MIVHTDYDRNILDFYDMSHECDPLQEKTFLYPDQFSVCSSIRCILGIVFDDKLTDVIPANIGESLTD